LAKTGGRTVSAASQTSYKEKKVGGTQTGKCPARRGKSLKETERADQKVREAGGKDK